MVVTSMVPPGQQGRTGCPKMRRHQNSSTMLNPLALLPSVATNLCYARLVQSHKTKSRRLCLCQPSLALVARQVRRSDLRWALSQESGCVEYSGESNKLEIPRDSLAASSVCC